MKLGADTVGVGVLLSAVGICCGATFLPTALGAGVVAGVVGFVSGYGWLATPSAIVGVIGLIWLRSRRRRAALRARLTWEVPPKPEERP